jgi:hypothetical protein
MSFIQGEWVMKKKLHYYMELKYEIKARELPKSQGGGVLLCIPALGKYATSAWGDTEQEALETLTKVMRDNIRSWKEDGLEIPLPEG